jgi:integral membrane sensor domain MASE1
MVSRTLTSPLARVGIPWSRAGREKDAILTSWLGGVPRQILIGLLVGAGYYFGSRIGFFLTPRDAPISMFWPPNAILLAAFVLAPYRMWWVLLLAAFPAHLLIQLPAGIPLATACGWFISNSSEALLGAACVRHFKQPEELFETVSGVLVFLVFGVVVATLYVSTK